MSILGINNRTENWTTARSFAPLVLNSYARAELARKLGEDPGTSRGDIELELFWKSMRDYVDKTGKPKEDLTPKCTKAYKKLFGSLRSQMEGFKPNRPKRSLEPLKPRNYGSSDTHGLFNNLFNTEIDIVLETPTSLFIGEAKDESVLRGDGKYVLVHQLIRQYVMARILLDLMKKDKKVVPFLVVKEEKRASVLKQGQVRFMIEHGEKRLKQEEKWLKKENVLTWAYIDGLRS